MQAIEVLGIDPGSLRTGWGIVRERSGILELVDCGIIRTQPDQNNFSQRLAKIYIDLCTVIAGAAPAAAAVEQVFTYRNSAAALKLGQARGVAIAACAAYRLDIYDYEPTMIKKSLVGTGRAEKEQVAFMVGRLLNMGKAAVPLDTTDALAAAICHLSQHRFLEISRRIENGAAG